MSTNDPRLPKGNVIVSPEDLMKIPVGSIILTGKKLDPKSHWVETEEGAVWFVFTEGKGVLINNSYPDSETEDLDWFAPWEVTIVGFNKEYVTP